jgi:hypothetical protein
MVELRGICPTIAYHDAMNQKGLWIGKKVFVPVGKRARRTSRLMNRGTKLIDERILVVRREDWRI